MSDFATVLLNSQIDGLHTVIENGRQKYICFIKVKNEAQSRLLVEVSDGITLWFLELDEDDLEQQKELNNLSTTTALLSRMRSGFSSGDLSIAKVGTKVTVSIGKGGSMVELDLFEAKVAEKKEQFQNILFRLADRCAHLEKELSTAQQQIDNLKSQKSSTGLNALMDLSPKKGAGQSKARPSKVGMSVVNPSSKKRKVASGVVFDE